MSRTRYQGQCVKCGATFTHDTQDAAQMAIGDHVLNEHTDELRNSSRLKADQKERISYWDSYIKGP